MKKILAFFTILFLSTISIYSQHVLYGDGLRDDTDALNAWGKGETVVYKNGRIVGNVLENKNFLISWKIRFNRPGATVRYNTFILKYGVMSRPYMVDFKWPTRHYGNSLVYEDFLYRGRYKPCIILRF